MGWTAADQARWDEAGVRADDAIIDAADRADLLGERDVPVSSEQMAAFLDAERWAAEVRGNPDLDPAGRTYPELVDWWMRQAGFPDWDSSRSVAAGRIERGLRPAA